MLSNGGTMNSLGVNVPEVSSESGSIYFRVRGSGQATVVLLHDFFGTHQTWSALQMQLSRYFLTVAPDLRGHGHSRLERSELSIASMAADIVAILDHMKVHRAHVIGCSHGAVVAMHMARTMAERVESIVITSVPDLDEPEVISYGREYAATVFPRLEAELDHLHGDHRDGYSREVLLTSFVEALDNPPEDHTSALRNAKEIECPVLILGGDSDPVMSLEKAVSLTRRLPDARLCVLPETGHLAHRESPTMYTEAVLDHLWRHRVR
jgi:pimeloyl-ACP methyl ester carboxylesterase